MTNCAESSKNGSALKNPQKINVWNALLEKKLDFWLLFGALWVPGCLPRRPGSVTEFFHFFIDFRLGLKTGLDWRPGGPRELPGVPQASPGHFFRSIFNRFFDQFPHALFRNCFPLVPRCEMRHFRKSCGIFSEVARKLPVIAMQYAFSCWISLRVQAMVGKP